jgi:uncharacterized protein (TIGR02270 family)
MSPSTTSLNTSAARPAILPIVLQHAQEAAHLRHVRSVLVRAPHVGLLQLGRLDERIEAHLDGLAVAGAAGRAIVLAELENLSAGTVFAAGVLALRTQDTALLAHLLPLAGADASAARGLASALGWVDAVHLRGLVQQLLSTPQAPLRALGLRACALHRVDPGAALALGVTATDAPVRAAAWHAATVLGRTDLLPQALGALQDEAPLVRMSAAGAACRLGAQRASKPVLDVLAELALQPGSVSAPYPDGLAALACYMVVSPPAAAENFAREAAAQARALATPAAQRHLVQTLALLGDTRHVPWLIERMHEPALARLAGEAFSWICGVDLAAHSLETLNAPTHTAGPSEDPEDDDVALDDDESLPWPDPALVQRWWAGHAAQLGAPGARYFMGQGLNDAEALQRVLCEGRQRQRRHAAWLLGLLNPAAPLFPVAAPARRQQHALATPQ